MTGTNVPLCGPTGCERGTISTVKVGLGAWKSGTEYSMVKSRLSPGWRDTLDCTYGVPLVFPEALTTTTFVRRLFIQTRTALNANVVGLLTRIVASNRP